jgi:hypothetical protein
MMEAQYLVQTCDERIHIYYNLDILLCDLALNPNDNIKLFRLINIGFYKQFALTSEEELKALGRKAA